MMKEPLDPDREDPASALVQERFRLERMWHCFLYVTVEAWRSATEEQKQILRGVAASEVRLVEDLLHLGDASGHMDRLRSTRDYMCHRDKREYWDAGRVAVVEPGMFHWALDLDRALSAMTLAALGRLQTAENAP